MGEYKEGIIRKFWPDNTEEKFYICTYYEPVRFEDILDQAREHFQNPEISLMDLSIESDYIQTDCLGYDQYDPGDYNNFLVITLNK